MTKQQAYEAARYHRDGLKAAGYIASIITHKGAVVVVYDDGAYRARRTFRFNPGD